MDRQIVLTTLAAAALAFAGLWLLMSAIPGERASARHLPWEVARDASGRLRAFGLTLGRDRLADLRARLGEEGSLSLFVNPDGSHAAEAYFDDILLGNLRADWVATLEVDAATLAAMHARGLRISQLGSGSQKIKLTPGDAARLTAAPLRGLAYLPWKGLRPRDIEGNFGTPARRLTEPGGVEHWLYPERGLDIARAADGGVVIQYLNASDFERAAAALAWSDFSRD